MLDSGKTRTSLGQLVEIVNSGRRSLKKDERRPGKYPYCGAGGVIEHVNTFTHDGDFILLAAVGSGLGAKKKTAYLMSGKFHAGTNVHVLRVSKDVDPKYLMYYLKWADLKPYAHGAAMLTLPARIIPDIPVMLPSLMDQKRIVGEIESASDDDRNSTMDRLFGRQLAEVS